jgi:hypothetical protein
MGQNFYGGPEPAAATATSTSAPTTATSPPPPANPKIKGPSPPAAAKKATLGDKLSSLPGKKDQPRITQPPNVTGGELRPYQLDALNWLIQLFENGMNGILAD